MEKKYLIIGAAVFVAFIVGLGYLAQIDATTPSTSEEKFVSYAEDIGLDIEQFKRDIASDEVSARVKADMKEGESRAVASTPTVFVNGEKANLQEPNDFEDKLAAALEKAEIQEIPEGARVKGAPTPTVIIEEFSDLQCPACKSALGFLGQTLENNPDTVVLSYKHFPLSFHFYAEAASKAAEAAANQGKFWEMHDILFEEQSSWSR